MQICFVGVVKLGLDACEQAQGAERTLLRLLGYLGFLQRRAQLRYRPVGAASGRDLDSRAAEVAAMLAANVDGDLVAEPQRFHGGVEHRAITPGVDQSA